jgi:D-alanyl-D-alanine carboxypeptidase/D-alanyl-D-alanine-endopeptidase (penicillin-binding protein 4)
MSSRCISVLAAFIGAFLIQATVPSRLQSEIDKLNADDALKHGVWGFCVMTADSGKIIASNNPELSLMPASTMKIITTGAALGLLGEDFRYETRIEYDGTFEASTGTIKGNLYIRGCGDPTLGSSYFRSKDSTSSFDSIPYWLKQKGVKYITGNIIADETCFDWNPVPDGWQWGDLGQYYGAGSCGLAYRDNRVTLHFNSTRPDSVVLERIVPFPQGVNYQSAVKADGKKDEAYVYGAPFGNLFRIEGTIPPQRKDFEVEASNPDPAFQCAVDLLNALVKNGIPVGKKAYTMRRLQLEGPVATAKASFLFSIRSPKLSDIVRQTNIHSDNTYAEQLCRTLGMLKGEAGTTEAGINVIRNYWQSQGISLEGLNMTDGCGLSRSNLVTTQVEASILQKICSMKWYNTFDHSLPVAGREGSMTSLCKGTLAENNLHAKTGYINRARGYAGYVKTKSGKLLCFSLLANNYTCTAAEMKKKLEKILVAMAELP